jgi:hypothetical protein
MKEDSTARLIETAPPMGEVLSFRRRAKVGKPALWPSARARFRFVTQPLGKQDVTLSQELAAQTETQAPPVEIPKWVAGLFGSGALAITAAWVYLLALGVEYLCHQLF